MVVCYLYFLTYLISFFLLKLMGPGEANLPGEAVTAGDILRVGAGWWRAVAQQGAPRLSL